MADRVGAGAVRRGAYGALLTYKSDHSQNIQVNFIFFDPYAKIWGIAY